MNWNDFLAALALMLVFEGLIPFFSPQGYRNIVQQMATMPESGLRMTGFISMLIGVVALYLIRG